MKKTYILHPFLFAIYGLLAPLSFNIAHGLSGIVRPLIMLIFLAGIFLLVFRKISKDWEYAGYLSTLLLFFLIFYGHVFTAVSDVLPFIGGSQLPFFLVWGFLLLVLAGPWMWKRITNPQLLTVTLNLISFFALIVPVWGVSQFILHGRIDPLVNWVKPDEEVHQALKVMEYYVE